MSKLEDTMAQQMALAKLPAWVSEYRFHPVRRWRFDFAWPEKMIALEVEGGQFTHGKPIRHYDPRRKKRATTQISRHLSPMGFEGDCKKYNAAALLGWRVIRVTTQMVKSGEAFATIADALEGTQCAG